MAAALTDDAVAPTSNAELEAIVATSPATGTISFGNSYTLIETSVTVPVTEILARSGWRSGNAIMLVTWQSADRYPNNDDNTNIVTRDDTQSAYYPYLTIDYTDGGTPPSGPEPGRFFLSP
ncbi:hypothetical protein ACIGG9_16045 [Pseudonocardia alni]|uniref:hypothetical protein n=1 Tax=Pseudonocardia alni TaxID=33907 RepID=UPI0033EED017